MPVTSLFPIVGRFVPQAQVLEFRPVGQAGQVGPQLADQVIHGQSHLAHLDLHPLLLDVRLAAVDAHEQQGIAYQEGNDEHHEEKEVEALAVFHRLKVA